MIFFVKRLRDFLCGEVLDFFVERLRKFFVERWGGWLKSCKN